MGGDTKTIGVSIPPNESLTGEIDLGTLKLLAIEFPVTWAGTVVTFQAKANRSEDQEDNPALQVWKNVYDDSGAEVTVTVGANRIVGIDAAAGKLAALRYLRIRSGTSAAPVGQNPTKQLNLICKM